MPTRSLLDERNIPTLTVAALAVAVLAVGAGVAWAGADADAATEPPRLLPAVAALPVRTDTILVGGYARGTFAAAIAELASDLSVAERTMVGRHLDKIYLPLLKESGLADGGRLRVAYERTRRSDGSTRSIQVLAAEAAVAGGMHTVFFYESGERPGYFDDLGRSLDPTSWAEPIDRPRVTSAFNSARMHPILRRILPHNGVDYAARMGSPVRATGDGSISFAAARGGYGNMVEVQHPNGYATRYAHLSGVAPGIRVNVPVRQGDVIGYVGMSGLATGPHLHYEVRRKGQPVNPAAVSPVEGPTAQVGYDVEWREERRALARLLRRAPKVVRYRPTPGG